MPPHELPAEELARPRNKSKLDKVEVPEEHIDLLRRYYAPEVERLQGPGARTSISRLWPHFGDMA